MLKKIICTILFLITLNTNHISAVAASNKPEFSEQKRLIHERIEYLKSIPESERSKDDNMALEGLPVLLENIETIEKSKKSENAEQTEKTESIQDSDKQ
jgi:hypothetical protein